MNNKIYTFLLIISVFWVGTHLFADISRYTKEYNLFDTSFIDNYYWSIYSAFPSFNRPNTRIIFN